MAFDLTDATNSSLVNSFFRNSAFGDIIRLNVFLLTLSFVFLDCCSLVFSLAFTSPFATFKAKPDNSPLSNYLAKLLIKLNTSSPVFIEVISFPSPLGFILFHLSKSFP